MRIEFQFLSIFVTLLCSTSLSAQVIFQPSASNCRPAANNKFKFCSAPAVSVKVDQLSATASQYLTDLPIQNTISFKLTCPSWPDNHTVQIAFGDQKLTLAANKASVAEKMSQAVNLEDSRAAFYTFTPKIQFESSIEASCKMEVISNVSIPNVDMLRTIVDLLKSNSADLSDLKESIDKAVELPAKWVAISDAPVTIDGLVDGLENEIAIFQQELDALKATDPAALSADDKTRIEELGGIIESYKSMVTDLKRLKTDLGDVATIASQCQADVQNVFCLDSVASISRTIDTSFAAKKGALTEINNFLQSESDRLKSTALSASNALKRLISK